MWHPLIWLATAVALAIVFGVFHLLGWRDDTRIISGTVAASGDDAILRGTGYAAAYFAAVLLSPILALGALFQFCLAGAALRK
jgi:hypothetical protein